ncbi:cardiolipin synthase ClsB [Aquabacterium lacunae]|uniref:Cardiolipin synthase ClsB n=1 Tax=Aquabacterium lacunae TaxID=2528630 RepID=A0A4Q9H652_9BURK|nr:cardiolipin synthase ClsB [Aquabacterium lacunae]TBO34227.1 cardiolipin synthase ClsB [Aquabacterium lacunae]
MPFDDDPQQALSLAWYAQRTPVYTGGHAVELLKGGQTLFPAMVKAIDAARHEVWMAMYLVSPVGQPALVLKALRRAAQRGVQVRLVIDGVGCADTDPETWRDLSADGVQLVMYRPVRGWWSLLTEPRDWRRMHLKLCAIDDRVGFVGGINLIDDLHDLVHGWSQQPRLDYALGVQGPVVLPIQHTIRAFWMRAQFGHDWRDDLLSWVRQPQRLRRLQAAWQQARLKLSPAEQQSLAHHAHSRAPVRVAFVMRDNLRQRNTIERAARQAIEQARSTVDLVCPYFYPGRVLRKALVRAAQRGVRVRLLLQGKPDYVMAALAARVLYAELQQHGVRVFEYQAALLHAKVICVDGEWCSVGSSNFDPLSLQMNLEANLLVKDRALTQRLSALVQTDFAASQEVPVQARGAAPWWIRPVRALISWTARTYLRLGGVRWRQRQRKA